jgi:acylphosphatase
MFKSVSLHITGKVQNVGFRYSTVQKAHQLGVNGYVRNHRDGSLYIEAEAEEANLQKFINWCHNGPSSARVDNVNIQNNELMNYRGFNVRY